MTDNNSVKQQIKNLVIHALNLPIAPDEIGDEDLLFCGELGIDSVATLEIVAAMEETFGITITEDDINAELFESILNLSAYVNKRIGLHS